MATPLGSSCVWCFKGSYLNEAKHGSAGVDYLNVELIPRCLDEAIVQRHIKVLSNVCLAQINGGEDPFT